MFTRCRCRECTAQYPTEAGLQAHRQKYHGAGGPTPDMAIPIVDLKQVCLVKCYLCCSAASIFLNYIYIFSRLVYYQGWLP